MLNPSVFKKRNLPGDVNPFEWYFIKIVATPCAEYV